MDNIDLITNYDIKEIIKTLETTSGNKASLDNKFKIDYVVGNVDEDSLLSIGFAFYEYGKMLNSKVPIYRLGNIEAIYIDNLLYIHQAQ